MIIGFSGKARAGKNYTAKLLREKFQQDGYNAYEYAFAEYLKNLVKDIFQLNDQDIEDKPDWYRRVLQKFGTAGIRDSYDLIPKDLGKEHPFIHYVFEAICSCQFDSEYIDGNMNHVHLITDVRFLNECEAIKEAKGLIVRVERLNFNEYDNDTDIAQHSSETEMDSYTKWDYVLQSESGMGNLQLEVDKLYKFIIDSIEF